MVPVININKFLFLPYNLLVPISPLLSLSTPSDLVSSTTNSEILASFWINRRKILNGFLLLAKTANTEDDQNHGQQHTGFIPHPNPTFPQEFY